jgi:Protein of unknown function (DUF3108)
MSLRTMLFSAVLIVISTAGTGWGAFSVPERLVFDVSWSGIKAGTAVQEIVPTGDGVTITHTAKSADWLSVFYKVDDHMEAVMAKGENGQLFGVPLIYRENLSEGRTRFHKEVTFDHAGRNAVIVNHLDKSRTNFPITPITYDSLSCFYFARLQNVEVGKSYYVDVFDGKRLHNTEVKVLRREELKSDVGTFKTILIMPVLKTNGIFSKSGDLYIWLSDDERHIPVKMKSKVKIGSITAKLVGGSYWPEKK